jgi:hypothetical protein
MKLEHHRCSLSPAPAAVPELGRSTTEPMNTHHLKLSCAFAFFLVLVAASQSGCRSSSGAQIGSATNQWSIVSQPKPGEEGPVVAKDAEGNTTVFGDYETKQTAPDGKVLQWYQGFADSDGKTLIDIIRAGAGDDIPTHAGIQVITHYVYRPDGNISEKYEFFGSGPVRQHVIYRYSEDGMWLKGDIYDEKGKHVGSEMTKPEVLMYGEKRKAQQ